MCLAVAAGAEADSVPVGDEAWPTIEKSAEVSEVEPSITRKLRVGKNSSVSLFPFLFGSKVSLLGVARDEVGRKLKVDRVGGRGVQLHVLREGPLCRSITVSSACLPKVTTSLLRCSE